MHYTKPFRNNIAEALISAIDDLLDPVAGGYNRDSYFSYVSLGQCSKVVFEQIKKEIMDFVNKTCYEDDSQ